MLRQKYATDPRFSRLLKLSGLNNAQLDEIDKILEDKQLYEYLESDLSKRYPKTKETGRNSTPVEVIFRLLVLKHLYQISYQEILNCVNENLVLRQFCRVYFNRLPSKSTLIRWANLIKHETLKQFNQRLTQLATQLKITNGEKVRTDGTVVSTNIHFPSDNSLLVDGVRVLNRHLQQARKLIIKQNISTDQRLFQNRHRTAKIIARKIDDLSRTRTQAGSDQRKLSYQKLLDVASATLKQAQQVKTILHKAIGKDVNKLVKTFQLFINRVEQVINQTFRRIVGQEKVPSSEKIVSIFENHSDIICRGKQNVLVEFGHKVWLDEVDGGIISNYRVLKGNPHDTQQLPETIDQHLKQFGHPPKQISADRGVFSSLNENYAKSQGIQQIILPKPGYKSKERQIQEKKRSFYLGRCWHNGVEGRISFLKRCFGFQRCLYHGEDGFERWVGWGIVAHNFLMIGRTLIHKKSIACE